MVTFDELKIKDTGSGDERTLTKDKWNGLVSKVNELELKIAPIKKEFADAASSDYDLKINSPRSIVLATGNEDGIPKARITITKDGKVGIRTSEPQFPLHIKAGVTQIEGEGTSCGIKFINDTKSEESPGKHIGLFGLFGDTFHLVTSGHPLIISAGGEGLYIDEKGLSIYSPNYNRWLIQVDNSGKLTTKFIP